MNRKQLLVILVIGLALGGIGLHLTRQKSASFERTAKTASDKLLGDFPVNDVAHITIRQHTNEVNLDKADVWAVKERGNYPANAGDIIEFARKLWDLRSAQSQKLGESQLGRMDLLPPDKGGTNSATRVELKGKDGKTIRTVLLGKKSMRGGSEEPYGGGGWPNGRWIYLPDKPGTAYLVSEVFDEIVPKPDRWLSKDFFKVEKTKAVSVVSPVAMNSWKVVRDTEMATDWKLSDAKSDEQLDSSKVSSLNYAFNNPTFNDVLARDTKLGQIGLDEPTVITLETFDNFVYTLKVGIKTNDNYPLAVAVAANLPMDRTPGKDEKPEDKEKLDKEFKDKQKKLGEKLAQEKSFEKWTYLVSSWTVDSVLKGRSQILAEKKEEPKKDDKTGDGPDPKQELPQAEQE